MAVLIQISDDKIKIEETGGPAQEGGREAQTRGIENKEGKEILI